MTPLDIKRIFELAERSVVALEKIAAATPEQFAPFWGRTPLFEHTAGSEPDTPPKHFAFEDIVSSKDGKVFITLPVGTYDMDTICEALEFQQEMGEGTVDLYRKMKKFGVRKEDAEALRVGQALMECMSTLAPMQEFKCFERDDGVLWCGIYDERGHILHGAACDSIADGIEKLNEEAPDGDA